MRGVRSIAFMAVWVASAAAAQPIRFFEYENLTGPSFTAATTIDNFERFGFNDRASSLEVHSGAWEVCSDAYFRGHCVTLRAGIYPSLRSMGLDHRVSAARPVPGAGRAAGSDWENASVVLYELDHFSGRNFPASTAVADLSSVAFNDRASSIYIRRGRWQFCSEAYYFGQCQVLAPGSYRNLSSMGMNNRISSLRPADAGTPGTPDDGSAYGTITVYDRAAISGQSATFASDVNDLAHIGFDKRVRSIDVGAGRWTLCSEAFFRGECRTFGPGEYSSLPGMNNVISSGRRISNDYPYSDKPNWQRDSFRQSQNTQNRQ